MSAPRTLGLNLLGPFTGVMNADATMTNADVARMKLLTRRRPLLERRSAR